VTVRKPPAKKAIAKKAAAKAPAKKSAPARRAPARKTVAKKAPVKKPSRGRGETGARSSGTGAARPSKPRGALYVVPEDGSTDAPAVDEKPKILKVATAAAANDERQILEALRARIAATLDHPGTPARDLAALSRRLLEIQREIKALDADDDEDEVREAANTPDQKFDASGI